MTVASEQPAPDQTKAEAYRQVAEIYHDAGIRSDSETLRIIAAERPVIAAVRDALRDVEAERVHGDMTRLAETETWLALTREDQAAAVAGVDAEQLAAMGQNRGPANDEPDR
jgi:hypothetical protein